MTAETETWQDDPDMEIPTESSIPDVFTVETSDLQNRLDAWLQQRLPDISRGTISRWIQMGAILVNQRASKPSYKPKQGDRITIQPPNIEPLQLKPAAMDLNILFEDASLLVINKPPGLVVHPGAGHSEGTLVHGLLHHCDGQLSGIGDVARPGIVHRLDQDTSGCIVVAKTDKAHLSLTRQFADRTVHKVYQSIACGSLAQIKGSIKAPIARHTVHRKQMTVAEHGRPAHTDYCVIERFGALACQVEVHLHTGRTHQIRVHLRHLGHPIFGDEVYGKKATARLTQELRFTPPRQLLHAASLSFLHPVTEKQILCKADLPDDFMSALQRLRQVS